MLRNAKRKGDKGRFAELLKVKVEDGEEGEEEEEEGDGLGDLTPTIPVMQMNNDQIQQYFPKLIKRMLAMEAGRGKKGRLWASSTEPAGKEKHTFLVDIDNICVICELTLLHLEPVSDATFCQEDHSCADGSHHAS